MSTNFLTFDTGDRQSVHRQANFAAISILARAEGVDDPRIFIVTDQPRYYEWIRPHVHIVEVDQVMLDTWRGPHDYFWRIKLRVMQHVSELAPGNLVYLDADVACRQSLRDFCAALDAGSAFMHRAEYSLGSKGGRGRQLWRQTMGGKHDFGKFAVTAQSRMWNAGLAALPAAHSRQWIADALECLDALCEARIDSAFLEQFSLSQSLDRDGKLQAGEPWFIHYWGNKKPWNALIACFLADVQLRQLGIEEACAYYRTLALDIPASNRRSRVERFANSLRKRLLPREEIIMEQLTRQLNG